LIAGNDIAAMDGDTRDILTNREIIAVDQDHMGIAGRRVRDDGDLEVWARPLADGSRAVVLFNRSEKPADITAFWPEVGYPTSMVLKVRDLWEHTSLGTRTEKFIANVPAHGVVMVRLSP